MAILKGFIFDLDGVLVDTAQYHFLAWRRLAQTLGIDFDEKDNEALKGVSRRESLEKILSWGQVTLEADRFEDLMTQKNQWYLEFVAGLQPEDALPGALDFLALSAQLNLKIGLGSASKNAPMILDKLGISNRFDAVVDGTQVSKGKPDPEVFLIGAERLKLQPQEIAVFEDAAAGIQAARSGGFKSVGVGQAEVLKDADMVIAGLNERKPAEIINALNF